jgi:hypothetical protein
VGEALLLTMQLHLIKLNLAIFAKQVEAHLFFGGHWEIK